MYWKPNDVENALAEVVSGVSIRNAAVKYGMSEGTLRFRLKKIRAGESFVGSGKKPVIKKDVEQNIAACIGTLCKLGLSPTMTKVIELVANYISANGLNVPEFKNGKPGRNWFQGFMKRNKLSLKKAEMISAARKAATANPFVIYDFYEQLEEIMKDKKLNANQILNCDESGFPSDPHECKVVSVKGKTAYKVTCGARREKITTLAVCSAFGYVLDPHIIFPGKNMQSTWRGDKAFPNTFYGISDSGLMTNMLQMFYNC